MYYVHTRSYTFWAVTSDHRASNTVGPQCEQNSQQITVTRHRDMDTPQQASMDALYSNSQQIYIL